MKIPLIITSILLILGITTSSEASFATVLESKEKKTDKYKALCSKGGVFDGCSVFFKNSELNSISIYGASELNLCREDAKIGYRSNPSSPYKTIGFTNSKLKEITKKERGIDHDFLFSIPNANSLRKDRLIIRFKNHRVAVDFAGSIDLLSSKCKN